MAVLKGEAEPDCTVGCFLYESGIVDLGLINQRGVIAKNHLAELGVFVEAHGAPNEGVELFHQKIGEVKGGDFS